MALLGLLDGGALASASTVAAVIAPPTTTLAMVASAATATTVALVMTGPVLSEVLGLPVDVGGGSSRLLLLVVSVLGALLGRLGLVLRLAVEVLGRIRLRRAVGARLQSRDGAGNRFGVFVDVETLVNGLGNGLDLGAQVPLNVVQVESVIPIDQVNSQTKVAVSAGSTNAVEVGFGVLGEVEVDDDVYGLDIDTTGEEIGADEVSADAVSEIVEDSVTSLLGHLGVTVEARVAQLGDLLGEKLDAVGRVAENDGLVDLKPGEEGVQAVDLGLFVDEGVVLGDTPQRQLVHEVDLVGADHVLVGEVLDGQREGGGEQHDLAVLGVELQELLDDGGELLREELIGFIHDKHRAFTQIGDILACQIENSAGCSHYYVDRVLKSDNVISKSGSSSGDHDVDTKVLSQ